MYRVKYLIRLEESSLSKADTSLLILAAKLGRVDVALRLTFVDFN
jgi:hypothetical protein